MCRYIFNEENTTYKMEVDVKQLSLNNSKIEIASNDPNLKSITGKSLVVNTMHELIAPKDKSTIYSVLSQNKVMGINHVYNNIKDALGKNYGRYCEIS